MKNALDTSSHTSISFANTRIYVDVAYVVKGLHGIKDRRLIEGTNGDLWDKLYSLYDTVGRPIICKVKSHIKNRRQFAQHSMSIDVSGSTQQQMQWQVKRPMILEIIS